MKLQKKHGVKKKYLTPCCFYIMIGKVMKMERIVEQTLLFDFYGELLTEHQRNVYEDVVLNDCSYSEAAQQYHISRQGVHDLVRRCNRILEDYEAKLHLVEKFLSIREKVEQIHVLAMEQEEIKKIAGEILEEL